MHRGPEKPEIKSDDDRRHTAEGPVSQEENLGLYTVGRFMTENFTVIFAF